MGASCGERSAGRNARTGSGSCGVADQHAAVDAIQMAADLQGQRVAADDTGSIPEQLIDVSAKSKESTLFLHRMTPWSVYSAEHISATVN